MFVFVHYVTGWAYAVLIRKKLHLPRVGKRNVTIFDVKLFFFILNFNYTHAVIYS